MNSRIKDVAFATRSMLSTLYLTEDQNKVSDAIKEFEEAVRAVRDLDWDSLCALGETDRQKLTACQQKVHEGYAKLKRVLLETYKELFQAIKEF